MPWLAPTQGTTKMNGFLSVLFTAGDYIGSGWQEVVDGSVVRLLREDGTVLPEGATVEYHLTQGMDFVNDPFAIGGGD